MVFKENMVKKVYLTDFLIINIPVFLCSLGAAFLLIMGLFLKELWQILCFIGSWQLICGAIMLSIDYSKNKKGKFLKLLALKLRNEARALPGMLKETICGLCLYLAVIHRVKNGVLQ